MHLGVGLRNRVVIEGYFEKQLPAGLQMIGQVTQGAFRVGQVLDNMCADYRVVFFLKGILFDCCDGFNIQAATGKTETGEVKLLKMTAVVDPGTVLNPRIVEGQIEGGLDMGAGMALREQYVHGVTKDWVSFKFPTMKTAFDMEVILLQTPRKRGPLGAVGIGEFVLLPTSAAIMTAIQDATDGDRILRLPATPKRVLESMKGRKDS